MGDQGPDQAPPRPPRPAHGWWVGPAFLLVALWLHGLDPAPSIPDAATPEVAADRLRPTVRTALLQDPPLIPVGGYSHRCSECHRLFSSASDRPERLYQHTAIRFDHGLNDRCFNCHDRDQREKLVLRDGSLIPFADSPRLCSQCHGTTYRDWQTGAHGKTLGGWDPSRGERRRLDCTECHDPHAPAFDPLEPLPGPHTLRMGRQAYPDAHHAPGPLALPLEHHGGDGGTDRRDGQHAPESESPAPSTEGSAER